MIAQEVMTKNVVTIDYRQPALDAVNLMLSHKIRHLPVLRNGEVMGILSVSQLQSLGMRFDKVNVGDICDRFVVYASPDSDIKEVSHAFTDVKVEAVPVLDNEGHILGMVTQFDVVKMIPSLLRVTKAKEASPVCA